MTVWPFLCVASLVPLTTLIVFGVLLANTDVFTVPSSIVRVDSCINDCINVGGGNVCTPKILGTFTWTFQNVTFSEGNFTMDSVVCKQICCSDAVNRMGSMQIDQRNPSVAQHFFDYGVVPFHTTYQALMITSICVFVILLCAAGFGCFVEERDGYQSLN